MATITIPYNFEPREYQLPLFKAFDNGYKRLVVVWHRRAGKDLSGINLTLKGAINRIGIYYYFFPTYTQGKKVMWKGMTKDGRKFLDYIPKPLIVNKNETEMSVELRNGSIIQIVGTDNIDSIMGTNPVGCVFSEYSLQNPKAWDLMRPILAENGGWALFDYTPRGKNHAYELDMMARKNDKWFTTLLTVDDTKNSDGSPVIPTEVIEEERQSGMSEDLILQEFYCSYEAAIEGAYYARQFKYLEENDRLISEVHEEALPVHTAWDLGYKDSTSIWFFQMIRDEVRIIDFYENSGEGLEHYINYIKEKGYKYGRHIAPHDIKVHEYTSGESRIDYARRKGINFETAPNLPVIDGIESVRRLLVKSWFDKDKCKEGINCLRSYHKEYNEKKKVFKSSPDHDWSSHASDAFRYLAVSVAQMNNKTSEVMNIF